MEISETKRELHRYRKKKYKTEVSYEQLFL